MAYDVFRAAGFLDVKPMSCEMIALNNKARLAIELDRPVAGATQVSIGGGDPDYEGRTDGWRGHLVLEHPTFLLDLTFAAAIASTGAPGFGDDLEPLCAEKGTETMWVDDGFWSSSTDGGVLIAYRPTPDNDEWERLPGWAPSDRTAVNSLAAMVKNVANGEQHRPKDLR